MKIVLFNGCPGSGKDTAVEFLQSVYSDNSHYSFKERLVQITCTIFNIPYLKWIEWYTREGKEIPRTELNNMSCRQALIYVSEEVIKPHFGKDFFGVSAVKHIRSITNSRVNTILFSDSGFDEETTPLINEFGEDNVFIVKIIRDGYSFNGDSRKYLSEGLVPKENYFTIYNNGTLDEFYEKLKLIYMTIK